MVVTATIDSDALVDLGRALEADGYSFVTVTPETHRRVDARARASGRARARSARDVFGWSRPFEPDVLPSNLVMLAEAAGVLRPDGGLLRSTVRFSSLGGHLFAHSAYPTVDEHSVFFGPDSYRYCRLVVETFGSRRYERLVDVGAGCGVGGIVAAPNAERLVLADINPRALVFAKANAILAGVETATTVVESDVLRHVEAPFDAVIANPPYLVDPLVREYRHGGGEHGEALGVRIVSEALARLEPGGVVVLYTGAAIVEGEDTFRRAVEGVCVAAGADWTYRELDPDVFGDEIQTNDAYCDVERIAAVALVATKRRAAT